MENRKGNVILATASYDYDIKLWNAHDGTCAKTFTHPDSVSFILIENIGKILV